MPFTTKELEGLGLDEAQVKAVMALKGQAIDAEREKWDNAHADQSAELEQLREQLEQRGRDLESLKPLAGQSEQLQKQLADLQGRYEADKTGWEQERQQRLLDEALAETLAQAHARDPKLVAKLLDREQLGFNKDGSLRGVSDQLKALQEKQAYLFDQGRQSDYQPVGGDSPSRMPSDLAQAMQAKDFTLDKWLQSQNGNTNQQ